MADVETRTPQKTPKKRKSFEVKQDSPKKPKLENGKTPQKVQTPKQQKNQNKNLQNSAQKSNKKAKNNSDSEGKKVAPFAGTAQIQSPKQGKPTPKAGKADNKTPAKTNAEKKPSIERKPRRKLMSVIKDQLKSDDAAAKAEAIKNLDNKLQAIQSRSDLTKTAMRKIKILRRLKNIAEGKAPAEGKPPGTKAKSDLSVSAKRRDRKMRAAIKSGAEEKTVPAANKKGQQAKGTNGKKVMKQVVKIKEPEEESEDEESGDEEETESGAEEGVEGEESGEEDSGEEEEDSGEEEEDSGEEEEGSDEEDDSDEEEVSIPKPPPAKVTKQPPKGNKQPQQAAPRHAKPVDLEALKKSDLVAKHQSRYVVFVGNIPYETTTGDLKEHFGSCGDIKHVRIPTEKGSNRPRGFAYVEAVDEDTYQKCLSKHHSQMKGRRINVLYTQGGKKKGDDRKKEIKVKNFKLGALRQQGKLLGSTKDSQKRSFRRNKQKMSQNKAQES